MSSDETSSDDKQSHEDAPRGLAALMPDRASALEPIQIPQLELPKGGGALRGIDEKFTVNTSNGTAAMSVALPLTPNRDAFTPTLGLSYSSGAGNGPFGLGWSVDLPSIQRKTDKRLPRYLQGADEDVFMIAGAEDLVPQLSEHGPDDWRRSDVQVGGYRVRTYTPRITGDFSRIERISHPMHGDYWKVVNRTNHATIFGRSPGARLADPADPARVLRWLPEFSYDGRGNWIAYEYKAEDLAGMPGTAAEANRRGGGALFANLYLKRIRYGNHAPYFADSSLPYDPPPPDDAEHHFELVLDYGEHDLLKPKPAEEAGQDWTYRTDAFSSYRSGFEVRTARLCRRILMFHHFPDEALGIGALVRSLDLTHVPATVNGIGQASALHLAEMEQAGYVRRGDGSYSRKAIPPLAFEYQTVDWDRTVRAADREALVNAPVGPAAPYRLVDLFGEGIAGILCEVGNGWFYKHNRGETADGSIAFTRGELVSPRPRASGLNDGTLSLEDVAGSGEKQVVVNGPQLSGFYALRDDGGWDSFRPFPLATNVDLRDPSVRRIDLTGDGSLEIVVSEDQAFTWYASAGKDGFLPAERALNPLDEERGPAVVFAEATQTIFLADMSGDGLTDIVRIRNGAIAYWPNLGYGRFGAKVAMSAAPHFDTPDRFDPAKLRLADITGTGASDLVYAGGDVVRAWLNQAGNGWSDATAFPEIEPLAPGETIEVADLLGQGTPCLVWSSNLPGVSGRPLRYLDLMGGRKPHLLTRYSNNMGKLSRLEYRSSTAFYLEDQAAGKPWATRLPFPVQVVSRMVLEERVGGTRLSSSYSYHHGFWDSEEREFRGFGRVDRIDSEDYDSWSLGAGAMAQDVRSALQPPILTRTWYHLGAWDREQRLLSHFLEEYWQPAYARAFPAAPPLPAEAALPDGRLVLAETVVDATLLARLPAAQRREAARAAKGLVLRQEVFALDAPAVGASIDDLLRQATPYTVDTHNCRIQLVQPRGPNVHGVYLVAEDEALSFSYERQPDDPRIMHALNLKVDAQGNVLEKANIAYGRDPIRAAAAADALALRAGSFAGLDDAARTQATLADALTRTEAVQSRSQVTVTRYAFTNDCDAPDRWRTRLPAEAETFEVTGIFPVGGTLLTHASLDGILDDANSSAIAFETPPGPGVSRRPIEHQRTLYFNEAASAPLPLGNFASHGLVFQGQALVYTPSLLASLFGARIADPATALGAGGYLHSEGDGDWWVPTGTALYRKAGETLADLRARFFKPVGYVDPFGATTLVTYHKQYFLLIEQTTDAAGNETRIERYDFRLLSPTLLRDPNDNLSAIVSDELALVKAQAFLGKDLDADNVAELEVADDLGGIVSDSSSESGLIAALTAGTDSVAIETVGRQLLNHATMRFAYDLDAWRTRGVPGVAVTITRERHHADDPAPPLHLIYEYTDGSGAVAMTKTQAEPGLARRAVPQGDGSVTIVDVDTSLQVPPRLRWVGTGRLVLNNKGKPVRRYEPYFSVSPQFETSPELVATGVSAALTYDAPGRLIRTDLPDGTIMRSEFSGWEQRLLDAGDTVLESRWHSDRKGRLIDAELLARGCDPAREAAAAIQSEGFAGTPMTVLLDPFARAVLSVEHNGADTSGDALLFATTLVLDVEGNLLEVGDPRGNAPMRHAYDMLGRRAVQRSNDAGSRWTLPTVTGNPLLRWDERNHAIQFSYDAMQRPTSVHVTGGDGATPLDNRVMHAVYGEGQPNDRGLGLRGKLFRRWDTGGMEEWASYDGKNNLTETARRYARDYRAVVDWSGDLESPLEAERFATRFSYDAVNRVTATVFPDGSRTQRRYNPANLLDAIDATAAGSTTEPIISAVAYDALGRRETITYGNGAQTRYAYDRESRRLIGLATQKGDGAVAQAIRYTHDSAGNLTHLEDSAIPAVFFDNSKIQAISHFGYDPLYRLIASEGREHSGQQGGAFGTEDNFADAAAFVMHQPGDVMAWRPYTQAYRYDAVGNIRRLAHVAGAGSYSRDYSYEPATNRIAATQVGANVYSYSYHPAHGFFRTMPHLPLMAFTFRDELHATSRQSAGAGTPETTYYVYDHEGRRIRKVTDTAAGAGMAPDAKQDRLYFGGLEIFRQHIGATAGLERTTLNIFDGERRVAMLDRRNAVDDGTPISVTRFQLSNHLGSSVLELDATGRALSYEEYHPFGTTAYQATDSSLQVATRRYRYCGMERDEESGFAHHSARYYCPWLARWTKPDPAGIGDGVNDYAYCSNNPIRLSDPSGHGAWDRFMGGLKMVGGALETVAGGALVLAGAATSEIGIGIPIAAAGVFVTAHGADVTVSGARTMWNGEQVDTFTSQGLQHIGFTRTQANLTDAGISIVGSLGASAITKAPAAASALATTAEETSTVAAPAVRSAVTATGAADEAAANSVSLAFKPGFPVGHNMVGVTTEGTTQWSHLVVDELAESGGMSYVAPGTGASVVEASGPSAAYFTTIVPVTQAEAQAARALIQTSEAGTGAAGTYSYLGNNCTTYATSVLREAGVVAPASGTPMTTLVTTALQNPEVVSTVATASVVTSTAVGVASYASSSGPEPGDYIGPDPSAVSSPAADTSSAPMVSRMEDEAPADAEPQVCSAEGYYNTVEQVCYSQ